MVYGIDKFREAFGEFADNYITHIRSIHPSQSLRAAIGVGDEEIESLIEVLEKIYTLA